MKGIIKIDYAKRVIHYNKAFEIKASDPNSKEYEQLTRCIQQFPNFSVERRTIKKNPSKETYAGLTYEYMENYIRSHSSPAEVQKNMKEFEELILVSECHSKGKRYPTIKKWFLDKYPTVAKFGTDVDETAENVCGDASTELVLGKAS